MKPNFTRRDLALWILAALLWLPAMGASAAHRAQNEQADPNDPAIQKAIAAQRSVGAGDFEQAATLYQEALEMNPGLNRARFELARVLAYMERYEEALDAFSGVVAANPENGAARRGEVTALLLLNRYGDARVKLEEGLTALPRDGQLAHTLARLLATAPVDGVRDGELAVQLATAVYEIRATQATGETLAMAYAEIGDFDKAIEIQRHLLAAAETAGDKTGAAQIREHLLSYLRREAWRADSPAEIALATEPPAPQ